jgi:hypothetical protein
MEQTLVNELIRLLCLCGAENLVGNYQREICRDGLQKNWSEDEVKEATASIRYIIECFDKEEAVMIVKNLMARYEIRREEVSDASAKVGSRFLL